MSSQLEIDNIVAASGLRLSNPTVPASSTDTGTKGDISWDSNYLYVCTSGNTWKRVEITSWSLDPYFSSVMLLLQDSLTDQSPQGQTITAIGTADISSTQSKFGGVSFLTNGASNQLTVANDPEFAMPGDFTIESWIYFDTYSASESFSIWEPVNHSLGTFSSNRFQFLVYQDKLYTDVYGYVQAQSSSLGFTAGQWYHVAASRQGSTLRLFLDGTQVASFTTTRSFVADEYRLPQSRSTAREMYFDDFRLTVGNARYTSGFTPPTSAFPN